MYVLIKNNIYYWQHIYSHLHFLVLLYSLFHNYILYNFMNNNFHLIYSYYKIHIYYIMLEMILNRDRKEMMKQDYNFYIRYYLCNYYRNYILYLMYYLNNCIIYLFHIICSQLMITLSMQIIQMIYLNMIASMIFFIIIYHNLFFHIEDSLVLLIYYRQIVCILMMKGYFNIDLNSNFEQEIFQLFLLLSSYFLCF